MPRGRLILTSEQVRWAWSLAVVALLFLLFFFLGARTFAQESPAPNPLPEPDVGEAPPLFPDAGVAPPDEGSSPDRAAAPPAQVTPS